MGVYDEVKMTVPMIVRCKHSYSKKNVTTREAFMQAIDAASVGHNIRDGCNPFMLYPAQDPAVCQTVALHNSAEIA
jgi:hypothetical protein